MDITNSVKKGRAYKGHVFKVSYIGSNLYVDLELSYGGPSLRVLFSEESGTPAHDNLKRIFELAYEAKTPVVVRMTGLPQSVGVLPYDLGSPAWGELALHVVK